MYFVEGTEPSPPVPGYRTRVYAERSEYSPEVFREEINGTACQVEPFLPVPHFGKLKTPGHFLKPT